MSGATPWYQTLGDVLVVVTTIAANITVFVGGLLAGRDALKKLGALVRLSSVRVVQEEREPPSRLMHLRRGVSKGRE